MSYTEDIDIISRSLDEKSIVSYAYAMCSRREIFHSSYMSTQECLIFELYESLEYHRSYLSIEFLELLFRFSAKIKTEHILDNEIWSSWCFWFLHSFL